MRITELQAYKRLVADFTRKGYTQGTKDKTPIYCWDGDRFISNQLTPGHFVYAFEYSKIKFEQIPRKYLTREFFLHISCGFYEESVKYMKVNPSMFDRKFFKDYMVTNTYALSTTENVFELMPLEFIDEEMVECAYLATINYGETNRRGYYADWFYSVHKRKPELLTWDMYILGARLFAEFSKGESKFLNITPDRFKNSEYYFALCLDNSNPVMNIIPENILTTRFLVNLLNDKSENIQCFSEDALEREIPTEDNELIKCWQGAVIVDGYSIKHIPLNEERIKFFLSKYDKDSPEYEYGFKTHYKAYLRKKNGVEPPRNRSTELAGFMTLFSALSGMDNDSAIDAGTDIMNATTDRQAKLPIKYSRRVPEEYCKTYDREEYLLEIYKKLGIEVLYEDDCYFYAVKLPDNIFITRGEYGYDVKSSDGETLIHYYDVESWYDREVKVDKVNVTL